RARRRDHPAGSSNRSDPGSGRARHRRRAVGRRHGARLARGAPRVVDQRRAPRSGLLAGTGTRPDAPARYFERQGGRMSGLETTAKALVAEGKGILAADESESTIKKRFDSIGVESTEENRRAYRDLLFTTEGVEEFISGVILFDETLRQSSADGKPFPRLLDSKGVTPGLTVDTGAKP